MASLFSTLVILILFCSQIAVAVDLKCPTNPITDGAGVFPKDTLTLTPFPNNYNCEIKFKIQDGFVVKLTLESNVTDGSGDSLVVTDFLGHQQVYTEGVTLYFAPAKSASVSITTKTSNAQFWFRYDYVYIALLEQNLFRTGSYQKLVFAPTKTYTFISPRNDNVIINTATADQIDQLDENMKMIYVYDGPDVNSPFVGNLYNYVNSEKLSKSSGNSTTLVNLYGTPTSSYAIANDYKSIITYDTYKFIAFSKNVTIPKNFSDGISNVYTFLSLEKDEAYLTDLSFGQNGHKVDFRPLTPSDEPKVLLAYTSTNPVSQCTPQMIPGRLFTMVSLGPEVTISLSSTAENWLTPYNGRLGYIFSASLWNPGATSGYNYTFNSSQLMTFTFNFQSAIIHRAGEKVQVQVGRPGADPFNVIFVHSVANPGIRVANGTYLMATYYGDSPSSSSIITFQMVNADGTKSTTMSLPETTTSSGWGRKYENVFLFGLLTVFVMNLC